MLALEALKKGVEQMTDIGTRSSSSVRRFIRRRKAHTAWLRHDGSIPNNSRLPLIYYRNPVHLAGSDPAAVFERLFESNGWTGSWRDCIYDNAHYHLATHEVLCRPKKFVDRGP